MLVRCWSNRGILGRPASVRAWSRISRRNRVVVSLGRAADTAEDAHREERCREKRSKHKKGPQKKFPNSCNALIPLSTDRRNFRIMAGFAEQFNCPQVEKEARVGKTANPRPGSINRSILHGAFRITTQSASLRAAALKGHPHRTNPESADNDFLRIRQPLRLPACQPAVSAFQSQCFLR